ncbi:hypothetical protein Tco_1055711 [Tanacetum coccineum]|uniref:Uncharacterized protein n=1 Tax=Tanacetum coccineum TaxID=301880 RepID=A0ABQ5H0Q0_9ASTR
MFLKGFGSFDRAITTAEIGCKTELEKYMAFNDHTVDYDKLERKLNETQGLLAQKEINIKEGLKLKACEISVVKEKHDELVKQSLLTKSHYEGLVKEKTKIPYDTSDLANRFTPDREETLKFEKESRSKLDKDLVKPYDYTKQNSLIENFKPASKEYHDLGRRCGENLLTSQTKAPQLPQTSRNTNPCVSTSTGVIHKTNVSRPQLRSTQMKDKVVPNNSQVKDKKTEVENHPRISSISNKTKFVTTCNDSLQSRTSNVNVVCATCGECVFNWNYDACVSKFLNDMNAKTKKPKVVHISPRKPKSQANKSVATPHKKTVASESTI